MNKELKTQKIQVNNGQELIAKAREYKSNGGEWKLLERYNQLPSGNKKDKKKLGWGIIISDGEQSVDIFSTKNNLDKSSLLDEIDARPGLHQLFPEAQSALFAGGDEKHDKYGGRPTQARLDTSTFKLVKEANGEYNLYRYLVAENFHHLKQIIRDYFRENEAKIYNSINRNFSDWVEIIDGQDGNIYLYVGEKHDGGREIKIGIKKEEFEKKENFSVKGNNILEIDWNLLMISANQPLTSSEQKKYFYEGLEENWQTINRIWENACRWTLESLRDQMTKKLDFLDKESDSEIKNKEITKTKWQIAAIDKRLEYMEKNHSDWYNNYDKNCSNCGRKMCCDKEGHECGSIVADNYCFQACGKENINHYKQNGSVNPNEEMELVRKYMEKNDIYQITIDNGNLLIEYNSTKKETLAVKGQELQTIFNCLEKQTNKSIVHEQSLNSSGRPEKSDYPLWIGVGAVGVLIGVIITYFLVQKKQK